MSRRRRREPAYGRLIAAIIAVVALAVLLILLSRAILGAVKLVNDGGTTTRDPMFAEPVEEVTRPPEPDEGVGLSRSEADPSTQWVEENQTPVDKTAEELSLEDN